MKIYKTDEVFIAGGMPELTYVARSERQLEGALRAVRTKSHKLVVITGNTKAGKTVLTRRIFPLSECIWLDGGTVGTEDDLWSSILEELDAYTEYSVGDGRDLTSEVAGSVKAHASAILVKGEANTGVKVQRSRKRETRKARTLTSRSAALVRLQENELPLVIDDFHFLPRSLQGSFVRGTKRLIFDGHPIILIAIPHRRFDAVKVEREMTGRLHHVKVPTWETEELLEIAREGFPLLNVVVSDDICRRLADQAHGSPHLMQEFCRTLAERSELSQTHPSPVAISEIPRDLFPSVAETIGKAIFARLTKGVGRPRTRRWETPSGEAFDIYDITLRGLARLAPGMNSIEYAQLRTAIRESTVGQPPAKSEVMYVLKHLSNVAAGDEASTPILDWDETEQTLHVTDPFFAFHLSWGGLASKPLDFREGPVSEDSPPFGPVDTLPDIQGRVPLAQLYDDRNELYQRIGRGPTLVIGRRGAGKTAYLAYLANAYIEADGRTIIWVDSAELFSLIAGTLESTEFQFVENVSELWMASLWLVVMQELYHKFSAVRSDKLSRIAKFLNMLVPGPTRVDTSTIVAEYLEHRTTSKVDEMRPSEAAAREFIRENNLRLVVLMDSLETYRLERPAHRLSMAGLLRCIGQLATERAFEFRGALPAELYPELLQLAENPLKDFSSSKIIFWSAAELISLAAKRYAIYLRVNLPTFYRDKIAHLDLDSRKDVKVFWGLFFSERVLNHTGQLEEPIVYILRHTQLLPRQLLMILNNIFSRSMTIYRTVTSVPDHLVKEGILEVSGIITQEIMSSFRWKYPLLNSACSACLPHLPPYFSFGDLHRSYVRLGYNRKGEMGFSDFREMLTTAGVVGVVTSESERYVSGIFEYSAPHRLIVSEKDRLCVHPLFSIAFRTPDDDRWKPVYPSGTEIR